MDSAEKLSDGVQKTLDNQYLFWSLMLFAIVFGWLARPPLPNWLLSWFDNPLFQYFVLFALVYTGSKDLKAAFWSPLIFMAIMYLLSFTENKYRKHEGFEDGEEDVEVEGNTQVDGEDDETEDVVVDDIESGDADVEEEEKEQEDEEEDENEEFEDNPIISNNTMKKMNQAKKQLENVIKKNNKVNVKNTKKNNNKLAKSLNEGFSDAYDFSNCGCGF